jgi:hypothetical protein
MKKTMLLCGLVALLAVGGCIKLKHEMTIQPVHVTVDINIKIDRALDDFFGDIDKAGAATAAKTGEQQEGSK